MFYFAKFVWPCEHNSCDHVHIIRVTMWAEFVWPCEQNSSDHVNRIRLTMWTEFVWPCEQNSSDHVNIIRLTMWTEFAWPCEQNSSDHVNRIHLTMWTEFSFRNIVYLCLILLTWLFPTIAQALTTCMYLSISYHCYYHCQCHNVLTRSVYIIVEGKQVQRNWSRLIW